MFSKTLKQLSFFTLGLPVAALAAPPLDGIPDVSFQADGKALVAFDEDPNNRSDFGQDIVTDATGRSYIVGSIATPNGQRIGIVRLDEDGEVDLDYGVLGTGRVIAPDAFTMVGEVRAAVNTQGILFVGGTANVNSNNDFVVCRFSTNGVLTPFPGTNFSCVTVGFNIGAPSVTADILTDIAVQPDGKIVLIGTSTASLDPFIVEAAIARLEPTGNLDTGSFGNQGKFFFLPNGVGELRPTALAIADNGKIVASCRSKNLNQNQSDACVMRFTAGGAMDGSFAGDGFGSFPMVNATRDASFDAVSLRPRSQENPKLEQDIVVAGKNERNIGSGLYDGVIAQVDGTTDLFDSSFNTTGFRLDSSGENLVLSDIELSYDGTATVVGTMTNGQASALFYSSRFLRNGSRDVAEFNQPFGFITADIFEETDVDQAAAISFSPRRMVVAGFAERLGALDYDYAAAAFVRDRIFHDGVEQID